MRIINKIDNVTCDNCKKNFPFIIAEITDAKRTVRYCPNCMAIKLCNEEIKFTPDKTLLCEITNKLGAVHYRTIDEDFILNPSTMIRFISHNLTVREYKKIRELCDLYDMNDYMIHDDFYTEDGIAIQPLEFN